MRYTVKVTTKSGVNIRTAPNEKSEIVGGYTVNSVFIITKIKEGTDGSLWMQVEKTKNWVCYKKQGKSYIKIIADVSDPSTEQQSSSNIIVGSVANTTILGHVSDDIINTVRIQGEIRNELTTVYNYRPVNADYSNLFDSTGNFIESAATRDVIQQNQNQYPPVKSWKKDNNKEGEITYNYAMDMSDLVSMVDIVKKNMSIPSAYDRATLEKYNHQKFNRWKLQFPDTELVRAYGYAVFTRPDLSLYKSTSNWKIASQISKDPQMQYIMKNNPNLGKQLTIDYSSAHDFLPLLTNRINSLDISDESLETEETGETFSGFSTQYALSSIRSLSAGSFTAKFPEMYDLSLNNMFQLWVSYESNVYRGIMETKDEYIGDKILDYACDVTYFLLEPSTQKILFWTKYYGAFPTSVPKSNWSFDLGSQIELPQTTISFSYMHKEDQSPIAIAELNKNAKIESNSSISYVKNYEPTLGHAGKTWVGAPYVETVKEGSRYWYVLRFKK